LKFSNQAPELTLKKILKNWHVSFESLPSDAKQIAAHRSAPLKTLVKELLLNSNNIYAESLLKTLGKVQKNRGSFKVGIQVVKEILREKTNIQFDDTYLVDGSGLSRYNLITPWQLNRIMSVALQDASISQPFRAALSVSGKTGALKSRLTAFDTIEKVQAKTGWMRGISGFTGIVKSQTQGDLIVTLLVNQAMESHSELRALENTLCEGLIES